MAQNHLNLIATVILVSTILGLFFKLNRGRLIQKYSNESDFKSLNLDHELNTEGTILLFSTEYCSICPGVKRQINAEIGSSRNIGLIEIDAVQKIDLAKKLHVKSSPTSIFFNSKGNEVGRIIGAPKPNQLKDTFRKLNENGKEKINAN